MTTATQTTSVPNSSWLAAGMLALLAFGACCTGAIVWWRSRTGNPGTGELMFYLFVLPGGLLCGALAAQKRLTAAPAPTPEPVDAPAPMPATLPVGLLAAAVRWPYGATLDDLADSLARSKARPALDTELTNEEGFPLLTARCSDAVDSALQAEITVWLGDAANDFSDEQWRALVLASSVTAELATALPLHHENDNLRLAPVVPVDWPAAQRDAAGRWLQHTVVRYGWPAEGIAIVPLNEADLSGTLPAALLSLMATAAPGLTLIVAGASHVGDATVQAWTMMGPARLYRILSPNSAAMGDCWMSEEVFKKLQSAPDPREAWRKYLAVWPDWNVNGQFVIYDVKPGESLNVWRGIAASQTKAFLPGEQLEGGFEQIIIKISDLDTRKEVPLVPELEWSSWQSHYSKAG